MFKKIYIVVSFLLTINMVYAQSSIKLHVIDKKNKHPIINASTSLLLNGVEISKISADSSGFAKYQPIDTGIYNISVKSPLYHDWSISGVRVYEDEITHVEIQMRLKSDSIVYMPNYGNVCTWHFPIDKESSWKSGVFDSTDLKRLPTNDIRYIQTFFPLH